jgi:hypothetical protein
MPSSSRAPGPVLRSYRLRAPSVRPHRTLGAAAFALAVVGASVVWIVPLARGLHSQEATPLIVDQSSRSTGANTEADPLPTVTEPSGYETPLPAEQLTGPTVAEPEADPVVMPSASPREASQPASPQAATETTPASADTLAIEPEPTPSPPPPVPASMNAPRVRLVIAGGPTVNLRSAPSTASPIVAMLPRGTIVEELPVGGGAASSGWRRVGWNNREGWIAADLVSVKAAVLQQVPVADQGIDYAHPLQPGVYPLREISTGQQITDGGRPVYVDEAGVRVPVAPVGN